jgi:hypothetical protein
MKIIITHIAAAAALFLAIPALSHHMAEGIVTDELYLMIEENLILVDSPHLDADLSTIGTESDMTRVLTVTVTSGYEAEVIQEYADLMGEAARQSTQQSLVDRGALTSTQESSYSIEISEPFTTPSGEELVTVTIEEDIGQGESQVP